MIKLDLNTFKATEHGLAVTAAVAIVTAIVAIATSLFQNIGLAKSPVALFTADHTRGKGGIIVSSFLLLSIGLVAAGLIYDGIKAAKNKSSEG